MVPNQPEPLDPSLASMVQIVNPHDEVNKFISDFEHKWNLGLTPRPLDYSPSRGARSLVEKCVNRIKFLYHQDKEGLVALTNQPVEEKFGLKERLECLCVLLDDAFNAVPRTPRSRTRETPSSKARLLKGYAYDGSPISKHRGISITTSVIPGIGDDDDGASTTDEDDETPPQSPTLTAKAWKLNSLSASKTMREVSPSRGRMKRTSDGDNIEGQASKKIQRERIRGKLSNESSKLGFRSIGVVAGKTLSTPSFSMMLTGSVSGDTSVNTSFNFSQYRENQPVTANTSFNTVASKDEIDFPITSSAAYGTPDEAALMEAEKSSEHLNFGVEKLTLSNLPFIIRLEVLRVKKHCKDENLNLELQKFINCTTYESFRQKLIGLNLHDLPTATKDPAWENVTHEHRALRYPYFTFKAKLELHKDQSSGPYESQSLEERISNVVFEHSSERKSTRFQRRFGSDRFLYLNVSDEVLKDEPRFNFLLSQGQQLLGRKWHAFNMEQVKKSSLSSLGAKEKDKGLQYRVIFFATSGDDIRPEEEMSIKGLSEWFMPISKMFDKSFCKSYARFSLGFSKTWQTLVFDYRQIRFSRDITADGRAEDRTFNDPHFSWEESYDPKTVMNDGCSIISRGAAKRISKILDLKTVPSIFQGRIGGAKGIWIVCEGNDKCCKDEDDVWIRISDSQLKYPFHDIDETEHRDEHRLTFEVLRVSQFPPRYCLHSSFLPIMEARGVFRDDITSLFKNYFEKMDRDIRELANDPLNWFRFVYDSFVWGNSSSQRDSKMKQTIGSLPELNYEIILELLAAEFIPRDCSFLSDKIHSLIKWLYLRQANNMSVPLDRSVNVLGISDPYGVLEPGQIHILFSKPIEDSGKEYNSLEGREVLVTRHPAMRESDIQKVKAVNHRELRHLVNVVVFPSRGCIPLASKLQGGDYDGDTFALYWDEALTRWFKNAPAPTTDPDPRKFGVKERKEKLGDPIFQISETSDRFLHESFRFVYSQSFLLGAVTKFHEKICANEGKIRSPKIELLNQLHDILIDALKAGRVYTVKAWDRFQETYFTKSQINYPEPAFKIAIKNTAKKEREDMSPYQAIGKKKFKLDKPRNFNHRCINDHLYFKVFIPHVEKSLEQLAQQIEGENSCDDDALCKVLRNAERSDDRFEKEMISNLGIDLAQLRQDWNDFFSQKESEKNFLGAKTEKNGKVEKKDETGKNGNSETNGNNERASRTDDIRSKRRMAIKACHEKYERIEPRISNCPDDHLTMILAKWTTCVTDGQISNWSYLKASLLYKSCQNSRKPTLAFCVAGRTLMAMNAGMSTSGTAIVSNRIWMSMKPKRNRLLPLSLDGSDEQDEGTAEAQYDINALPPSQKRNQTF